MLLPEPSSILAGALRGFDRMCALIRTATLPGSAVRWLLQDHQTQMDVGLMGNVACQLDGLYQGIR